MREEPAVGLERRLLQKMQQLLKTANKRFGRQSFTPSITVDHALEGVRVNGHEQLVSACLAFTEMEGYEREKNKEADKAEALYQFIAKGMEGIREIMEKSFEICGECKGEGGKKTWNDQIGWQWDDCERCEGHGSSCVK
ncbi:hypothetical protein MYX75_00975 [Acidobacteria bacterium AH-259-A15]|nr:hypothetical protein [Acidobacteria bacterium AH-259-A15]